VEDHQEELIRKAVAYINSDGNNRGFVSGQGSHTLEPFYNEIIEQVMDPQTGVSVKERRYAKTLVDADKSARSKMMGNKSVKLGALGAGSDYSPFLQHLGIASMNIGFGGEGQGDQYHSVYDSYDFYTRFIDPGFFYCTALAKVKGRIMMRLADAEVLPVDFNAFHRTVSEYATELKAILESNRSETEVENRMIREKLFDLAKDPSKTYGPPAAKPAVPFLDFSKLENSLQALKNAADEFQSLSKKAFSLGNEQRNQLNEILFKVERSLIMEDGLPRRPWYRHLIYAPGYYTGYGVKTLPGIREGIEERHYAEAQEQINRVAQVLENYTAKIKQANALLN
jgi:N-acetylated-alpha-linked acidic dipeptidase